MSGKRPSLGFQVVRGFRGQMMYLVSTHTGNGFHWVADAKQGVVFDTVDAAHQAAERASREWGAKCTVVDTSDAAHVIAKAAHTLPIVYPAHKQGTCGCCTGDGSGAHSANDMCVCFMHRDVPNGRPAKLCAYHAHRQALQ
jgi:hypothetical protein